eukprot:363181-Chlamydomonas_euryale.AAC.13
MGLFNTRLRKSRKSPPKKTAHLDASQPPTHRPALPALRAAGVRAVIAAVEARCARACSRSRGAAGPRGSGLRRRCGRTAAAMHAPRERHGGRAARAPAACTGVEVWEVGMNRCDHCQLDHRQQYLVLLGSSLLETRFFVVCVTHPGIWRQLCGKHADDKALKRYWSRFALNCEAAASLTVHRLLHKAP